MAGVDDRDESVSHFEAEVVEREQDFAKIGTLARRVGLRGLGSCDDCGFLFLCGNPLSD